MKLAWGAFSAVASLTALSCGGGSSSSTTNTWTSGKVCALLSASDITTALGNTTTTQVPTPTNTSDASAAAQNTEAVCTWETGVNDSVDPAGFLGVHVSIPSQQANFGTGIYPPNLGTQSTLTGIGDKAILVTHSAADRVEVYVLKNGTTFFVQVLANTQMVNGQFQSTIANGTTQAKAIATKVASQL